ncbi:MAG: HNH endonuclease signature motif containing protein [Novosphingobium sp.]|uniref:HNH endonuclease n=1 Tax=Novosphingobium sp. TaxID=1874826 RepID=UPI00273334BE|nr:HNH endonuclease signature motif containing protein [Novosphingobium sp.]MDP3551765.1 HNH endonuclease signature motif containing protein [Novosphingobium sp.]
MVRNRSSKGAHFAPANTLTHSPDARLKWLDAASASFVNPSKANHVYYRKILELLWPEGHGLPGPAITESQIREHLAPYRDPFRRMRELQGDEGFKSIVKSGVAYQLQSPELSPKKEPRTKPGAALWRKIKQDCDGTCAKCGRKEPEITLSPDHRRPRSRGGTGDDLNWQPLCQSCNILKSAACQGCEKECGVCYWAYPEQYAQLEIDDLFRRKIQQESEKKKVPQNEILQEILKKYFREY